MADGSAEDPGPHRDAADHANPAPAGHDEGHELSIASLLDRGLPDDQRAEAERLVATCTACARLHADLVSVVGATRALASPARPRDFRLSAEDAARLASIAPRQREPLGADTRLTGEMRVSNSDHRTHDLLLVASLLDRPTGDPERPRAEALVAACTACAALHLDLVALREATFALPTPPRVRDYALSPEDARRLRRSGWRHLIAVFGSTRDTFSRPLAIGLTTIGLAGLLFTTTPWAWSGASSSAARPTLGQAVGGAGSGANSESPGSSKEAPAASAGPSAAGPAAAALTAPSGAPTGVPAPAAPSAESTPSGEAFDTYVGVPAASAGAAGIAPAPDDSNERQGVDRTAATSLGQEASSVDHVAAITLAGLLVATGVGLFVLRWAGRRLRNV